MKGVIELVRAIVRPAMALTACVGTAVFIGLDKTIPDAWWAYLGAATTFYFVQRAQERKNGG